MTDEPAPKVPAPKVEGPKSANPAAEHRGPIRNFLESAAMAVLMAGYESAEKSSAFVDVSELVNSREFQTNECACESISNMYFCLLSYI